MGYGIGAAVAFLTRINKLLSHKVSTMKLRYKVLNSILAVIVLLIGSVAIAIGYTEDCEPAASTTSENTMKAVIYRCYGGPEVLEYVDVAKPT
ncbi:MAG: hypothetical protein OET46_00735, partial [Xanthomonadales bacterium]|nr:hypothetical protein [Xanthomonadales bacterium]